MHDTAYHLVNHLLPRVPYRQWVLSLPRPIRWLIARDTTLLGQILSIVVRSLFSFQRRAAKRDGYAAVLPAAVTFVQHFGSALNANVHFHILLMDSVFIDNGPEQELIFLELAVPTQAEVEALTRTIARRVTRAGIAYQEHHGLDDSEAAPQDPMDEARARALQGPLSPASPASPIENAPPYRCAAFEGFSLHANVTVPASDRQALLRLVRYGARQSFS